MNDTVILLVLAGAGVWFFTQYLPAQQQASTSTSTTPATTAQSGGAAIITNPGGTSPIALTNAPPVATITPTPGGVQTTAPPVGTVTGPKDDGTAGTTVVTVAPPAPVTTVVTTPTGDVVVPVVYQNVGPVPTITVLQNAYNNMAAVYPAYQMELPDFWGYLFTAQTGITVPNATQMMSSLATQSPLTLSSWFQIFAPYAQANMGLSGARERVPAGWA